MSSNSRTDQKDAAANTVGTLGAIWYFAYGSNLSKYRMQQRTGVVPVSHHASLKDYRLVFNAHVGQEFYANIVPSIGDVVRGVVYSCDHQAMTALDRHEGVDHGCYQRVAVEVETEYGAAHVREVFIAGERRVSEEGRPNAFYLGLIVTGAREHHLPERYIQWIESHGEEHGP